MKVPDFNDWTAQRPPADFAENTVRAMLQDDVATPRRRGRGWLGIMGIAALLLGTSAWATLGGGRASAAKAQEPVLVDTVTEVAEQLDSSPERSPEPSVVAPAEPPAITPRAAAPPPVKARASEPKIDLEAPTITRHPRCQCDQDVIVCACIE